MKAKGLKPLLEVVACARGFRFRDAMYTEAAIARQLEVEGALLFGWNLTPSKKARAPRPPLRERKRKRQFPYAGVARALRETRATVARLRDGLA